MIDEILEEISERGWTVYQINQSELASHPQRWSVTLRIAKLDGTVGLATGYAQTLLEAFYMAMESKEFEGPETVNQEMQDLRTALGLDLPRPPDVSSN